VLRTEAKIRLGDLETAAAAFSRASSLGLGEPALCWYRAFAARHAAEEQWQAAFWYLDRMIEARPKLAVLYLERARAYIKRNRLNEAAADYAKAVDAGRETPLFWFEKARFDRERGKWQEAAIAFREGLALEPHDHYQWYDSSALELFIGDQEAYRRICRELLDRFGQSDDPIVAERVLKTCVLVPVLARDQNAVQKLADRVVTGTEKNVFNQFFQLAKGIADFRAGRSLEAIERLERCLKYSLLAQPQHYTLTQLFLSMTYEQAGRKDEARRTFEQARAKIDAEQENWKRDGAIKGNSDWLRSMSVLREALAFFKTP
jgi:tetratricopeptide (TPR) repeat protein